MIRGWTHVIVADIIVAGVIVAGVIGTAVTGGCSGSAPPVAGSRPVETTPRSTAADADPDSPPPGAATAMPTATKFTLEYVTTAGPTLGDDIVQYQSALTIDGATRIARLESVRAGGDAEGAPIGRFEATVSDAELSTVSALAAAITPAPPTARGGPGTSTIALRYTSDSVRWEQALNSHDPNALATAEGLIEPLNLMIGRLYATPAAAIAVDVVAGTTPGAPFVVRLRNIGRVELAVLDPTVLGGSDPDAFAGARVASFPDEQPGVTSPPLHWEHVPLQPGTVGGPRTVHVVAPGGQLEWPTRPWRGAVAGRHLVQAIIADYAGPSTIDGRSRVRGAVFSTGLEHTP